MNCRLRLLVFPASFPSRLVDAPASTSARRNSFRRMPPQADNPATPLSPLKRDALVLNAQRNSFQCGTFWRGERSRPFAQSPFLGRAWRPLCASPLTGSGPKGRFCPQTGVNSRCSPSLSALLGIRIISGGLKPIPGMGDTNFIPPPALAAHRSVNHDCTMPSARITAGPPYVPAGHRDRF